MKVLQAQIARDTAARFGRGTHWVPPPPCYDRERLHIYQVWTFDGNCQARPQRRSLYTNMFEYAQYITSSRCVAHKQPLGGRGSGNILGAALASRSFVRSTKQLARHVMGGCEGTGQQAGAAADLLLRGSGFSKKTPAPKTPSKRISPAHQSCKRPESHGQQARILTAAATGLYDSDTRWTQDPGRGAEQQSVHRQCSPVWNIWTHGGKICREGYLGSMAPTMSCDIARSGHHPAFTIHEAHCRQTECGSDKKKLYVCIAPAAERTQSCGAP